MLLLFNLAEAPLMCIEASKTSLNPSVSRFSSVLCCS
ncbi:hypothetical protein BVRB_6g142020 [Beta vulgaris subsp. vulgaris]|nr:hypothetical protein BVRB_6g142020 [Beta vulgaris subsp. vulgaris]